MSSGSGRNRRAPHSAIPFTYDGMDVPRRCITPEADVVKAIQLDLAGTGLRQHVARGQCCASGGQND